MHNFKSNYVKCTITKIEYFSPHETDIHRSIWVILSYCFELRYRLFHQITPCRPSRFSLTYLWFFIKRISQRDAEVPFERLSDMLCVDPAERLGYSDYRSVFSFVCTLMEAWAVLSEILYYEIVD